MKRSALLGCLIVVSGLAYGQDGFDTAAFQDVFTRSGSQVFIISNINSIVGIAQPVDVQGPLRFGPLDLDAEGTMIGIEGDGVRMPDEQFSLNPVPN